MRGILGPMKHVALLGLFLMLLPFGADAKSSKTPYCPYTSNRIHYARCVNRDLEKRPIKRYLLYRNMETPCIDKDGADQAECMRIQARIRRDAARRKGTDCSQLIGVEWKKCMRG